MHTCSPLCRSGFTGFSWQFISLSLWLSSGVHTKHIALSSPKPYSLDSLSTSISTLAVFSPLFFTLAAHDFPTPPTLAHSSRFHLSVLCFSPLPLFRITPPTPPPLYPPAPHQFPPLHLFSSGLVSLSLSPVNISLSFILHSSGPSSHPHPPPPLLPQGTGSLWLFLAGLWISVLPPEIYSVCSCSAGRV